MVRGEGGGEKEVERLMINRNSKRVRQREKERYKRDSERNNIISYRNALLNTNFKTNSNKDLELKYIYSNKEKKDN